MESLIGLVILALDVYAIIQIIGSGEDTVKKIIWSLVVLILPVVGLIIWFIAGPGKKPF